MAGSPAPVVLHDGVCATEYSTVQRAVCGIIWKVLCVIEDEEIACERPVI